MTPRTPRLLVLTFFLFVGAVAVAATSPAKEAPGPSTRVAAARTEDRAKELSKLVTQFTGVAISPLLGVGAVGAYESLISDDPPEKKGWYANPLFWVPALAVVAGVALKDSFGAAVPTGWKKPLDAMELLENKLSGLVAAGALVPMMDSTFSKVLADAGSPGAPVDLMVAGVGSLGAIDGASVLSWMGLPFALVAFAAVWLLSHTINVLILISPWGPVDAALKSARTAVMGSLLIVSQINPYLAAVLSLVIIVVALLLAGWAFRLTVFGTVFAWDILTWRRARHAVSPQANRAFSGKKLPGVPPRSYGDLLVSSSGTATFRYRPWLVLKAKEAPLPPGKVEIGRGLVYPTVWLQPAEESKPRHIFTFPPRCRGHEDEINRLYRWSGVRDAGLLKGWAWVKDFLGWGGSKHRAATDAA